MRLGIIGAGNLAQAIASRVIAAGHSVVLSNSRGPESMRAIIHRLGHGAVAGTALDAAEHDTVILAVPGEDVSRALAGVGDWGGRTLVDSTNHLRVPPLLPGVLSTSESIAELAPAAHVVKALNTLPAAVLASDPSPAPQLRRVLFVCGDDVPSKEAFRAFLEDLRYATVDLGGLAEGSRLQQVPGGTLAALNLLRIM
ncbi:NAD(P)-binding domain-containing protein [Microbacterium sp. zg.B48]|uniref:NADPH-dependent F420 reductase n=1 Tax=Microbacterium sp. zg.B48 TaxID=2969408 RepID=UPI00214B2B9A|nr:NAD(P)-binding domain-containing protein [Microbacterium sp. zg.B48]MCR2764254.1 NAD(P)-binding domain-containing protein [Microbacterium sp. zg.B48]